VNDQSTIMENTQSIVTLKYKIFGNTKDTIKNNDT